MLQVVSPGLELHRPDDRSCKNVVYYSIDSAQCSMLVEVLNSYFAFRKEEFVSLFFLIDFTKTFVEVFQQRFIFTRIIKMFHVT